LASKVPENPVLTSNCISISGVSYRYGNDSRWVIDKHDWELERGSVVHLDSPSGSGKTTLLRMIAGLLAPTHGRISIFGVDAKRARNLVLYVPQHCKLFEASIRENLELLSGAGREEIQRVSELTGLRRMLAKLPMGEETLVAADGGNISSGQRQLVVLTAAFASPRPVVLLDEATSQVDVETRAACQWDALFAGRTVIRVEHG
jgi:ABC-type bacteriocin/lantibiotic exporter with double-glycine peptidase domain